MVEKIKASMLEDEVPLLPSPAAKGDVAVYSTDVNKWTERLPVGADGTVLTADSAELHGVKWATPASGAVSVGDLKLSALTADHGGWLLCDGSAVSRTTYAALFAALGTAFGAGDGSTTFHLPDARGRVPLAIGSGQHQATISAVDTGTDQLTVPTNESLQTGQAVVYASSGSAIGGLTSSSTYYVIRVSATLVKLATSRANAVAGTAIDLTSAGSGTQTLTLALTARALGDRGGVEQHALTVGEIPAHTHTEDATDLSGAGGPDPGVGATPATPTGSTGGSGAHYQMPPFVALGSWFVWSGVTS